MINATPSAAMTASVSNPGVFGVGGAPFPQFGSVSNEFAV